MAKLARGFYYSGRRTREWLKVKAGQGQEAVIVGFTEPRRSRQYFGALVLAVHEGKGWRYVGRVGTGFDLATLKSVHAKLVPLDYIPAYGWVVRGGWNIADAVERSYDLEGMSVGTVGAGRIGLAVLRRLKPFGVKLHYTDKHRLPKGVEEELGLTFHPNVESLVKVCDVVTINTPLHPETEHL